MAASPAPPSTAEKPQRADARRNRAAIVEAARALVAEQGAETQIDDVARRAGVGVGTVYRHFPTKDALIGELIAQCARENAALTREAQEREDPWDAFTAMILGGCELMAADAAKRRMWFAATEEAFAYAQDAKAEMHEEAAKLIDRAHEAGVLRLDFTPADMPMLMCSLSSAIEVRASGGDWRRIVEIMLDGLRAR